MAPLPAVRPDQDADRGTRFAVEPDCGLTRPTRPPRTRHNAGDRPLERAITEPRTTSLKGPGYELFILLTSVLSIANQRRSRQLSNASTATGSVG